MSYDILKKELKENIIRNIYLFHGVEDYLVRFYTNTIKQSLISELTSSFNYLVLDNDTLSFDAVVDFCECPPMMSNNKLLLIKNVLKNKKHSQDIEKLIEYLPQSLPSYMCVIFAEDGATDKRTGIVKMIEKIGLAVEFAYQDKMQLANWVERFFKDSNIKIGKEEILHIIENTDPDMQSISNECNKIIDYCTDKGCVEKNDIDNILTHSLSSKVFEMLDNVAQKSLDTALKMLDEMLALKEPVPRILVLIARHVKIMLQIKLYLKEGISQNEISKRTGVYYIYKYLKQSEDFSIEKLEECMELCGKADLEIKSTGISDKLILEKLIVEIAK